MSKHILRPYQEAGLNEVRALYAQGIKKVLLHLATGGGKTTIFCDVLISAHKRGKHAFVVVRGRELVNQASLRLAAEDVPHGVLQAEHWRYRPDDLIQVCSIDTLYRRKLLPKASLIVIDECHMASSQSYLWLVENYPDAYYLAVSATPHVKKGLRHIADRVVRPITMSELIAQGYLVPPTYYIPSKPRLDDIAIDSKTGDYNQTQLGARMNDAVLFGDLVESYRKYAFGRPALCFAVNIDHSLNIVNAFLAAGIPAAHIEANTPEKLRRDYIEKLSRGEIKLISNVGVLCTGVDIPCASAIIMARPTKSYNLYIQILGRATRPFPGKNNFVVLDHGATVEEHGLIEIERECNLDGHYRAKTADDSSIVRCAVCYRAWNPTQQWLRLYPNEAAQGRTGRDFVCRNVVDGVECLTDCRKGASDGAAGSERNTELDAETELVEITSAEQFERIRLDNFIRKTVESAIARGYKSGWVFHKLKDKYGNAEANRHWKKIKLCFLQEEARRLS